MLLPRFLRCRRDDPLPNAVNYLLADTSLTCRLAGLPTASAVTAGRRRGGMPARGRRARSRAGWNDGSTTRRAGVRDAGLARFRPAAGGKDVCMGVTEWV
ncbi:hypothetical protein MAHJHV65_35630 [Mycobacterium avium subsp. hominissuis]